ncbi:unnamed protein product [Rhizophagus irregularis]|nr:unnamed protein product [Rhizophagus irregularis]
MTSGLLVIEFSSIETDFSDNRNDELNHIEAEKKIDDNNDFDLNDINIEDIPTVYEWKIIKEAVELLRSFENATCFLSGVKYPTISLDFINSQEKCNSIINQLKTEFEIFKHNSLSAVIFDRNIDELTTAMGNFWKKKNAKITAPIKDEFQHYLNVSELPALEEYDPFV